jgi:crotonobetainyl-CoA:carnitine CoA-transferase CaiB-like acyl-CoA transferase
VLFMPSERKFWRNFCEAAGRMDLFERFPGKEYAEHESGNHALRRALSEVFLARTTAEWLDLGLSANFPIAPVYDPAGALRDPHFIASMNWIPARAGESETIGIPRPSACPCASWARRCPCRVARPTWGSTPAR